MKYNEIQTFEEYKEYNRQRAKDWYERNRDKKLKYQKDRYYNMKKTASDADEIEQNISNSNSCESFPSK